MSHGKDVTGRSQNDFEENVSESLKGLRMIVGRWMIFKETVREALKV